jgi:hypothetical protein
MSTKRLSKNLKSYNPLKSRNRKKSKKKQTKNSNNMRKKLLKFRAHKYAPKRSVFNNTMINKNPKLKDIYFSHRNNLNEFIRNSTIKSREDREEAFRLAEEEPVILSVLGDTFEVEAPEKLKRRRRRQARVDYAPARTPKGVNTVLTKIRKGQNKCGKCKKTILQTNNTKYGPRGLQHQNCPEQTTYRYVGLPHNINKTHYRGFVPNMVKNSHLNYNTSKYGNSLSSGNINRFIEE